MVLDGRSAFTRQEDGGAVSLGEAFMATGWAGRAITVFTSTTSLT